MRVTKHAEKRGEERLGLSPKPFEKMAGRAMQRGIRHAETAGSLKRYLAGIYLAQRNINNLRIYGEYIYLFHNQVLITVYNLPNEFKEVVKKIKSCRK